MTFHRASIAALTAAGVALAALAGCGGDKNRDKSGAVSSSTVTLRLALPDSNDDGGAYFAEAVTRRSKGRVRLSIDDSYDSGDTRKEAGLAGALTAGRAQVAYMASRNWAKPGLPAFQALSAPFSVTTQAAMQAVARSDFAENALASLKRQSVVGLGLVPAEPRQLLSRRPLAGPEDFRGASLRVVLNPAVSDAISALGARPVDEPAAQRVTRRLARRTLTGAETSPQYALSNGYVTPAPYLTAYGIYAKFQVIAVSGDTWSKLDDKQRAALKAAAADTVEHERALPAREAQELGAVCRQSVVVVSPRQSQIDRIVSAANVDPSGYADAAKALAAVPGTGPARRAVPIPAGCPVADDAAAALATRRQLRLRRTGGLPPSQTTTIPDGTYVTTTTVKDLRDGGQNGADWNKDVTWAYRLKDGTVRESQKPDYPDQGPCRGRYQVKDDQVTFTWEPVGGCEGLGDEVLRWSSYKGQLALKVVDVADTASKIIYGAHPWRKVG